MKKIIAFVLAAVLCTGLFSACAGAKAEIALITDSGSIQDKSFNQGAWEGIVRYAEEKSLSHKDYQPKEASTAAYVESISKAVKGGAKVIVAPGALFAEAITTAQIEHPTVSFVFVDAPAGFVPAQNTVAIVYAEQQAGFLAGYAAMHEGYTQLGFMGGVQMPTVVRYGLGFVQGAEYAAMELGLEDGAAAVKYYYTGSFEATEQAQQRADAWYRSGTQIIFACGGGVGSSVMSAASETGMKVIGVDVDQSTQSPTVITSAMKGLANSVYDGVKQLYAGTFPGGQTLTLDAENGGVMLSMETSKFETFTQDQYNTIYAKLAGDTQGMSSSLAVDGGESGMPSEAGVALQKIVLEEIK